MSEVSEGFDRPGTFPGVTPMVVYGAYGKQLENERKELSKIDHELTTAQAEVDRCADAYRAQSDVVDEAETALLGKIHTLGALSFDALDYLRAVMMARGVTPPDVAIETTNRLLQIKEGTPVAIVGSTAFCSDAAHKYTVPVGSEITFGKFKGLSVDHAYAAAYVGTNRNSLVDPDLVLLIESEQTASLSASTHTFERAPTLTALLQAPQNIRAITNEYDFARWKDAYSARSVEDIPRHDFYTNTAFKLPAGVIAGEPAVKALLEHLYYELDDSPQRRVGVLACAASLGMDPKAIADKNIFGARPEIAQLYKETLQNYLEQLIAERYLQLGIGANKEVSMPFILTPEVARLGGISIQDLFEIGHKALVSKIDCLRTASGIESKGYNNNIFITEAIGKITLGISDAYGERLFAHTEELRGDIVRQKILEKAQVKTWPYSRRGRKIRRELREI